MQHAARALIILETGRLRGSGKYGIAARPSDKSYGPVFAEGAGPIGGQTGSTGPRQRQHLIRGLDVVWRQPTS
jgi:hypothetical protein